jgi:hypothetical protein
MTMKPMGPFDKLPAMDTGPLGPPITAAAAPKKKGGLFGSGGVTIDLNRALAGYLAGIGNPAGVQSLQAMNIERQRKADAEAQSQLYGQRREDEFQDWVRKQAYEAANPDPVNNDTVADYNFIAQQLGPEAGKEYLRNRANPPRLQFVPGIGLIDASQMGAASQGAPAAPGVTFTPLDEGGPTPQASGGFRSPF